MPYDAQIHHRRSIRLQWTNDTIIFRGVDKLQKNINRSICLTSQKRWAAKLSILTQIVK